MYGAFRKSRGFSLVETLVAITILLIAVLAPMRIASQSIKTAGFAREQLTAVFLAQEGIESVLHHRDADALDGDSDTWDWYSELEAEGCADDGCSYDPATETFVDCSTVTNCQLYFDDDASSGAYYTHTAGSLPASAFTRIVTVTEVQPGEAHVVSTVSWESLLVKDTVSVTSRTRILDQYEPDN
jgi:prepilin-type N-terminal cleavage/methylation domain-containing protein